MMVIIRYGVRANNRVGPPHAINYNKMNADSRLMAEDIRDTRRWRAPNVVMLTHASLSAQQLTFNGQRCYNQHALDDMLRVGMSARQAGYRMVIVVSEE